MTPPSGSASGPHGSWGGSERELFATLRTPEERQLEWLAARTAAKEAVAELVRAERGLTLLPAEIEILPAERGGPEVVTPRAGELDAVPLVSLAHTHGRAVAAAMLAPRGRSAGVGVDVESLHRLPPGFAEVALSERERELLAEVTSDATDEWLLRCWCAKEAAGKAVGEGMGGGAGVPAVVELSLSTGRLAVTAGARRMQVQTWRDDDLVAATATFEEGTSLDA